MGTNGERRSGITARLELVATLLLIVVAVLVGTITVWDRLKPQPTAAARPLSPLLPPPEDPISIEGAPILGDKNAKVALVLFSEFECPFCGRAARELIPAMDREYFKTGKVFLAWRHYPLAIHKSARKAAEGAECAGRQGRFWQFHDWAFEHQAELGQTNLADAASTLGLDAKLFQGCLDGQAAEKIDADLASGTRFKVAATPTWFIGVVQSNGMVKAIHRIEGAKPFADFRKAIDTVVATNDSASK